MLGLNYRLTDFQAALGTSQLSRLPAFINSRRELTARYREAFAKLNSDSLRLVEAPAGSDPALHLMIALIDFEGLGISRAKFMNRLREMGVGTQVHYIPIHRQPYYIDASRTPDLPGADRYYARCLSLPFFPAMTNADVDKVVEAVRAVAAG